MAAEKIAVVTMGVKIGREQKGYTRFLSVCEALVNAGYSVELITSSFQHWYKKQRDTKDPAYKDYPFGVSFVSEPGYTENVDLKRLVSHAKAAKNLPEVLDAAGPFDLIYSELPPNDVALAAANYAKSKSIPFVADVNDLWPEAMRMVLDIPIVSSILFYSLSRDAKDVYSKLSAVVGTSDEYALRPYSNCDPSIEHITIYVGSDLDAFDAGVKENASKIDKPKDEFWVAYAGTIGTSYDIETLVRASAELCRLKYRKIKMLVLGDGPDLAAMKELANKLDCNVEFTGYQNYPMMAAYLSKSDVTVNSLIKKAPQSMVTKIGDYLAAGIPMINTGSSSELRDKVQNDGFGINVEAENPIKLSNAILQLYESPTRCKEMGAKARKIAEEQFDRKTSYRQIPELVSRLITANKVSGNAPA